MGDVDRLTGLRVRTHDDTPVGENSANCRWLLEPPPNAVFLNVAAPNAGVDVNDLFHATIQSMAGQPVPGLGASSWQGTGPDDGLVVLKAGYVLKLTVEGVGSRAGPRSRNDDEHLAQLLATQLVARM